MAIPSQLQTAKLLIDARDYDGARAILETMRGNATATRWLNKLDQIAAGTAGTRAPAAAVNSITRWEYCRLHSFYQPLGRSGGEKRLFNVGAVVTMLNPNGEPDVQHHLDTIEGYGTEIPERAEAATYNVLAALGCEGWEAISTTVRPESNFNYKVDILLKRPVRRSY